HPKIQPLPKLAGRISKQEGDTNAGGFTATQAEAVVAQADFHRVAQRREAEDLDDFVFEQAHFHHALQDDIVAVEAINAGTLALLKFIERHGCPAMRLAWQIFGKIGVHWAMARGAGGSPAHSGW
ncbi:MAG TPA: hypothetical protein VFE62_13880, partial [Gemmataceae bacterium]|nr:hypothetical protein [Gemmataceae bacterium]